MPKITIPFESEDKIPAGLKSYKKEGSNEVEVWVNTDDVALAGELNPTLEANRNKILGEKDTVQKNYNNLLQSSSETARKYQELQVEYANKTGVSTEELAIVQAVKSVDPNAKAEDIKTRLTEHSTFKETIEKTEATKTGDAIFAASGLKSRPVFDTVWNNKDHNPNFEAVVWKDEMVNGEAKKVPYVKVKTAVDGKHELTVADYAAKTPEWTPFMASLTGTTGENRNWLSNDTTSNTGGGQTGQPSSLQAIIDAQNAANKAKSAPLMPAPKPAQPAPTT